MTMELRPISASDTDFLKSLEEQEDVWEFIGSFPVQPAHQLFAVMDGRDSVGVAGLVKSDALGRDDFEILCAMKSEVQTKGYAKQACQLVMSWAFDTAKVERVIACIDDGNQAARSIASKLGMQQVAAQPPSRTVYVKYREAR
jgi:RimJ/RimL family protein N-acetyltransferase